jgi:hypothetical protein
MGRYDLLSAYEMGSATSLHVRFAGAIRGLRLIPGGVPTLVDTEVEPDDLYSYHAAAADFLRTQQRIFRALDPANPERDLSLSRQTRDTFEHHVGAVWAHFPIAYGSRI